MKIIHTLVDDKFIDTSIEVFEHCKQTHIMEYFIITENVIEKFTYIKKYEKIKQISSIKFIKYVNESEVDAIIVHGISSISLPIINLLNDNVKIVWKAWGYDIYRFPNEITPLIKLQRFWTLSLKYWKQYCKKERFANLYVYLLNTLHRKSIEKAISRINYFSGCLPVEYDLMKKNKIFKAEHAYFDYFDLNSNNTEQNIKSHFTSGRNIILGNSAGLAGNHLDILEILRKCELDDRNLIIPLSYGGKEHYKQLVNRRAKQYFADKVCTINQFMSIDKYFSILDTCGFAIYGYEQQAALGNICQALWSGIKIFLPEKSITYIYLKSKGFLVYSIQRELTSINIRKPLTTAEQEINRRIYLQTFSSSACLKHIEKLINTLETN